MVSMKPCSRRQFLNTNSQRFERIDVIFLELPVSVVTLLEDQVAIKKESVTFKCKLSKVGQKVKWMKDGKEIKPCEKYQMSTDGQNYQLKVTNCDKDDSGKFSLVCGDKDVSASLEVKGSYLQNLKMEIVPVLDLSTCISPFFLHLLKTYFRYVNKADSSWN